MGALADCRYAASLEGIEAAAERIAPYAHVTPVMTCAAIDKLAKRQLFFKCEVFQKTGSFKFRGACNAIFLLPPEVEQKGVVAHSSGNHAGAVALAAKIRGVTAHIVVPSTTPQCKVTAVEAYGGRVIRCEPTMESREQTAAQVQQETGAFLIPPYNFGPVICGQGTLALELLRQVDGEGLDAIVVPVSGGGMISGVAVAAKSLRPSIKIIAAEPTGTNNAADVAQAKAAGHFVPCPKPHTIADGLQGRLGDLTWPIVRDFVDVVITVSEAEIVAAMRLCYERMKVVVEPSGAVGLAAVLSAAFGQSESCRTCQRVGVVLCGGNVEIASEFWKQWQVES